MSDIVENEILPLLLARGFSMIEMPKEATPMWHLHRLRTDRRFDVISIVFDKKRRPLFDAVLNVIPPDGILLPWGEFIAASKASAIAPLNRILVRKKRTSILGKILPYWCGLECFGFHPTENAETNRAAAHHACREFAECLAQMDRWWKERELGPNLFPVEIEVDPARH